MGSNWISMLLAACLACVPLSGTPEDKPPPGTPAVECRCLVVGMDLFLTEACTAPCSANNAELMAGLLDDCLPEGSRITRRVNGPGSAEEMNLLVRDAFWGAGEEDVSFLYLSTHGVAWEENGATRTALILSDGVREQALDPAALRIMMNRVPGKKVLILDCCHAGAMAKAFSGPEWRVIAGCGAEEDAWFWAAGEATGTGYFTAALENALRASGRDQIDPDGDGTVSLAELGGRIREIYGICKAEFLPEGDAQPLFRLPETRAGSERILDLRFDPPTEENGQVSLSFRFRTETEVRIEYRLIPMGKDGWDFTRAAKLPDRERSGQRRGVLSPGEKERTIRVSRDRLGGSGQALLQIVSFRGVHGQVPIPECTVPVTGEQQ